MQRIVCGEILDHFAGNSLVSNSQFGFVKGRSSSLHLISVVNVRTMILDRRGCIDGIYCDFQKTFDKLRHKRHLKRVVLRNQGKSP